MSLRLRVALAVVAVTSVVSLAVGAATFALIARDQRRSLDAELRSDATLLARPAAAALVRRGVLDEARGLALVRVSGGGDRVATTAGFPQALPLGTTPGLRTLQADGSRWRVLTVHPRGAASGLNVEVARDLAPTERMVRLALRRIVFGVLAAAVGSAALAWLVASAALAPLAALRRRTDAIAGVDDLDRRVPEDQDVPEVDALGASMNGLLSRLETATVERERSLETARSFAADAAHELRTPLTSIGTNLELIGRGDLDDATRAAVAADARAEHAKLTNLLDGLRLLAQGDLRQLPDGAEVDLLGVLDEVATQIGAGYDHLTVRLRTDAGPHLVWGWEGGLAAAIRNLVVNVAVHARGATVAELSLRRDADEVVLSVADDGPGLAEADLTRVLGRFARAAGRDTPGSGLGLALVAQQAQLHGGSFRLANRADRSGLIAEMRLPASHGRPPQ
ncbi:MAG: HAMP domain-containing histidine kinase [Acidimicrobiia bacterium]|nr:HAMP domain-containing histidine kinase [Acidimicrobiia bacterium]